MLHPAAAHSFANVENEQVALVWCTFHELQFVLADALQLLVDLLFSPINPMHDHVDAWRNSRQVELFKFTDFNRSVRERIVTRTLNDKDAVAAPLNTSDRKSTR